MGVLIDVNYQLGGERRFQALFPLPPFVVQMEVEEKEPWNEVIAPFI